METREAEAVVFDLDGTLVDTLADIAGALNRVLARGGHPAHEVDAYRMMVGDGARTLVSRALPEGRADLVEPTLAAFREEYSRHLVVETRPYPGVADLLDGLRERAVGCAIVSNKPDTHTQEVVRRLLDRWPWAFVSGQREGVPPKPSPRLALEAAEALEIEPGRCLFVGDSNVDMKTASAARMIAVGVSWGFRTEAELREHGARLVVRHPSEITRFF